MKWPKLRELREAVTSFVTGPYTHPFPAAPTPLPDRIRGKPVYVAEKCIGCGACAEVCTSRAIEVSEVERDGKRWRRLVVHHDRCIFCGECERGCSTGEGIRLTNEYELSGFDRSVMIDAVERELAICELCGNAVAPRAHLLWIHERLGEQAAANLTVSLVRAEELGLRDTFPRDDRPLNRADIQRVLCPACRRTVTLMDEWGPVT